MTYYINSLIMFIKSEMEYKASFIITMIGAALNTLTAILGIVFLLQKFGSVRRLEYRRGYAYNRDCSFWAYSYRNIFARTKSFLQ